MTEMILKTFLLQGVSIAIMLVSIAVEKRTMDKSKRWGEGLFYLGVAISIIVMLLSTFISTWLTVATTIITVMVVIFVIRNMEE